MPFHFYLYFCHCRIFKFIIMEIKDLVGLSEPLVKLIETFSNGCTGLFKPYQIKRIAKAEREVKELNCNLDMKLQMKQALLSTTIDSVKSIREQRQCNNIADIYSMAAEELAIIENVSDEPVNVDWASQFFDYAKDISDDEAKTLWSRILADEIKSPNTYNKRTLFVLKHIEVNEAKWFVEICPFILNNRIVPRFLFEKKIYPYSQFLSLCDCGLFTEAECIYSIDEEEIEIKGSSLTITLPHRKHTIEFQSFGLTNAGIQLYSLVQSKSNRDYMIKLKENIKTRYNIQVELI